MKGSEETEGKIMGQTLKPNASPEDSICQKIQNSEKSTKLAKKLASSEAPLKLADIGLLKATQDEDIKKLLWLLQKEGT